MTDKEKIEKIVAYLARRMHAHNLKADIGSTGEVFDEKIENAKYEECKDALNFIDSMQEEPVSEDLEEAANDAVISLVPSFGQKYSDGSYVSCIRDSFKREELIKLYKAGAEWQKQQMMRRATDGQIEIGEDYLRIKCLCMSCPPQYDGKLVRLIIIKED